MSGTPGYLPVWNEDGVSLGDSPLYSLSGKVGLGLTDMDYMIDIAGVEGDNRPLRVRGSDGGGILLGSLDSYTAWGALWSNDVTPDASNYTLATSHYGTEINMPAGASFIRFNVAGIEKLGMAASGGMWVGNGYSSNDPGAGKMIVENSLGVKVTAPTAYLHLGAGTATAGTAPLKLTSGTPLYTKEDGALEYDSGHLWFTMGTTRYRLDQQTGSSYTLPVASVSTLGGIKIGSNLTIDGDGVLSASAGSYTLPTASGSVLGGVKIGAGISITDGVISAPYSYSLPMASGSVLGGIKIGSGLSIDGSGIVSTTYSYSLPTASATVLGGVKVGANLSITDGVLSAAVSGGDMVWPSGGYGIPVYSGTTSWIASTLSPTGNGSKELKVNSAGTGFEFVAPLWTRGTETVKILSPTTANDVLYISTNTDYATIDGYNSHATDGIGVRGEAVGGVGVAGFSETNVAGLFQTAKGTTSVLSDVMEYSRILASGTPANGLGGSFVYGLLSLRDPLPTINVGKLSFSWTDITVDHEYAKYTWSLMADGVIADKMELLGTGQFRLNKYGTATPFTGTAVKYLAVNSSGYVIESAGTGDSGGILLGDLSALTPLSYDNTTGVFTHLSTDGNRHLPSGGASNGGKFLQASSTDGVYSWSAVAGVVADGSVTGQLMYWNGTSWAGTSTGKLNWTESTSLLALGSLTVDGTPFQTRLYGGTTDAQLYGLSCLRSAASISRPSGVRTLNLTRPDICGVGMEPNGVTPSANGYQLVLGRSPFLSDIVIGDGTYTDGASGDSGDGLSNAYIRFPNYSEGTLVTNGIGLIKSIAHGTAGKVWTSAGPGSDPTWETPMGFGTAGSEGKVWTSGGFGVSPTWEDAGTPPSIDGHVQVEGASLATGTGSEADLASMSTSVTPKGSKILVLFSAPFRTAAVSQTFIVYINVDGSNVKESAINHYTNDSVIAFHHMATVTPGATITVKIRWNAPSTITQIGTMRRTLTIIDLP